MYSPIPHDLSTYDDKFDFERNGFCPHQWEISVPQKNCIIWGVVLSYLRTADFAVPRKFEERLNRLMGIATDPEPVKSAILDFNPFFNIHKCFFDETLQKVSHSFKKVLNENRLPVETKTVSQDLQLISTLLKSNILIVDLSKKRVHLVTPSDVNYTDMAAMTFICREYWNRSGKNPVLMKRFTFSLSKDLCWELRRKAFQIILETTDIRGLVEKEIQQLTEKKEKKVNILIALLEKNLTHVISELYDSSYIVAKLADAGFETDPRVLDAEGFSAFYYALQSGDNNLVYILYRYAANNCYESVNTFRDPNPSIISNLSKVEEVLKEDCSKSNKFETFGERAEPARVTYQDLLRFNAFLTQVSQGINKIWNIQEDSSLKKAEKQKEIVLTILETYDAFYSVGQLDSQHISEEELIENYTKHKTYYDNLDFTVALLFFDNIFLLKSVLKSPREGLYSDVESSFLLNAVTNKYFTGDAKKGIKIQDLGIESDSNYLSIIPLLERLNLRKKVKHFCFILREKKLVEEDIVPCIPQEEIIQMLRSFPELKDEFLISRLNHYMKTALETTKGLKQKFVIQRALQVIGESINNEKADPSSIKHLLRKCLPSDTLKILKKARDTLSHLKSFQFPLKFETEEDGSLFTSIRSEIRNIKVEFENIFYIQRVRLKEFLLNRGLESVQKFQQDAGIDMQPLVKPMKNFGDELRKSITDLEYILDQKGTDGNRVVPNIDELCRRLMGFASKGVKKEILDEIPLEVSTRDDANNKLLEDLDRGITLDLHRFDSLFLEKKDLDNIKKEYKKYLESEAERSETSKGDEESEAERSETSKGDEESEAERSETSKGDEESEAERSETSKGDEESEVERSETSNRKKNRTQANKDNRNFKQSQMKNPKFDISAAEPNGSSRRQEESKAEPGQTSKRSNLLHRIKKSPNPLNTLDLIFEKKKVSDSQLKVLFEVIPFSDEAKSTLNSLIEISKSPGNNLANLLNRIKHLYGVSIDEQYDIRFLWERAKSSKAKQHLVYKIIQRYFRESSFQASLEMLLFDCFGIFKKNEGQKKKRKSKEEKNKDKKKKRKYKEEYNEDHKKKRSEEENNEDQKMKRTEKNSEEPKKKKRTEENDEDQKKKRAEETNGDQKKKRTEEENNNENQKKKRTEENNKDQKKEGSEENVEDQKKKTEGKNDEDQKKKTTEEENNNENQKKKRTEENNKDQKKEGSEENAEDQKKKTEEKNNEDQKKKKTEENDDQVKKRSEEENNEDQKKKKTEEENDDQVKKRSEEENNEDQKKKKTEEENDDQVNKRTEEENSEDQKRKRRSEEGTYVDQSFWLKDSYLFNGIDVRNVLAHGDPLLESIGDILDPKDLPSELVKKMLQLLEDRDCIEALCDLWQKAKQSDQNPGSSLERCELKKRIVCCARWQEYSKLLAEDPNDSETCEAVVSFLKETTASQKRSKEETVIPNHPEIE